MWGPADMQFLRSMRIAATNPPAPLPRFRVEPTKLPGWYRVIDAAVRYKPVNDFGPDSFSDPRGAAEDLARQRNEQHEREQSKRRREI